MFGLLETAGLAGWAERCTSAAPPAAPSPHPSCTACGGGLLELAGLLAGSAAAPAGRFRPAE